MPKNPGSPEASTHTGPGSAASSRSVASRSAPRTTRRAPAGASVSTTARPPATTAAFASSGSLPGGTRPSITPRTAISGTAVAIGAPERPVAVAVARVVDVRAPRVGRCAQGGADEHERLGRDAGGADLLAQRAERAADDDLVRPRRLVDDRAGRLRGVAAREQIGLQLARPAHGEEERHRRAVRGHR